MKKTTTTLLAAALFCGAAHAQTATAPNRQAFGTGELPEFLKSYDLNEDGKLSVEERQAYEKVRREAKKVRPGAPNPLDTDGDGALSDAEKQAARDAMATKIQTEREARFTELDKDANGVLSSEELAAIPQITPEQIAMMISHLDADKDGSISKDEFLAALTPKSTERPVEGAPAVGSPVPLPLASFDADQDGVFSAEELAALVAAVDTSTDGIISAEEMHAYLLAHPELLPTREGPGGELPSDGPVEPEGPQGPGPGGNPPRR